MIPVDRLPRSKEQIRYICPALPGEHNPEGRLMDAGVDATGKPISTNDDTTVRGSKGTAERPLLLSDIQCGLLLLGVGWLLGDGFVGGCYNLGMGSGKTRVGVLLSLNIYDGCSLVICSKTLLGNWCDEIVKLFGNTLKYEVLHSDYMSKSVLDSWSGPGDGTRLVLTTPEVCLKSYKLNNLESRFVEEHIGFGKSLSYHLPSEPLVRSHDAFGRPCYGVSVLHSRKWCGIFIDECQNYTNIRTSTCRSICSISRNHSWLLSGTPIQEPKSERLLGFFLLMGYRQLKNLSDLNSWLASGTFPGLRAFCISHESPELGCKKIEHESIYEMSEAEKHIFLWFRQVVVNWFEYYKQMKAILPKGAEELRKIRGHLLSLLTYTRIGIVAPKRALDLLMEKIEREPFLSGLDEALEDLKDDIRTASHHSSRLDRLHEILEGHPDEGCIVFSNFVQTLETARLYLLTKPHKYGRKYYLLESSQSSVQRSKTLQQFREDSNGVLMMTYGMGSEGLNLQSASVVVNLEPAWNVSKEEQAVGRAYRFGQRRDVHNYYVVSNTQFELCLLMKQAGKTKLLEEMLSGDRAISTKMKTGTISYLEMAELIESEPILRLMRSGERHKPKSEEESVLHDLTPTKILPEDVKKYDEFNVPEVSDETLDLLADIEGYEGDVGEDAVGVFPDNPPNGPDPSATPVLEMPIVGDVIVG